MDVSWVYVVVQFLSLGVTLTSTSSSDRVTNLPCINSIRRKDTSSHSVMPKVHLRMRRWISRMSANSILCVRVNVLKNSRVIRPSFTCTMCSSSTLTRKEQGKRKRGVKNQTQGGYNTTSKHTNTGHANLQVTLSVEIQMVAHQVAEHCLCFIIVKYAVSIQIIHIKRQYVYEQFLKGNDVKQCKLSVVGKYQVVSVPNDCSPKTHMRQTHTTNSYKFK
jgi:hypothetical protein